MSIFIAKQTSNDLSFKSKINCTFDKSDLGKMDIQSRKIEFIQEFLKIQSEDVIAQFEKLLQKEKKAQSNEFSPMSIVEFNQRIDKSESDFEGKRYRTSSELLAKYK